MTCFLDDMPLFCWYSLFFCFLFFCFCGAFGFFAFARFGRFFDAGHLFLKFFDASSRIDKFLFSGIKWMTLAAELHTDVRFGRSGYKRTAARAGDRCFIVICRMDVFFHKTAYINRGESSIARSVSIVKGARALVDRHAGLWYSIAALLHIA